MEPNLWRLRKFFTNRLVEGDRIGFDLLRKGSLFQRLVPMDKGVGLDKISTLAVKTFT